MRATIPSIIAAALGLCFATASDAQHVTAEPKPLDQSGPAAADRLSAGDMVQPEGLPVIGKWMIDPDGTPAHWLGEIYEGKKLREPINVIIIDQAARSVDEAKRRLIEASSIAGYPSRFGHSGGYLGYIGGYLYPQLPQERDHAFSNAPFEFSNNHGRVFGPLKQEGSYIFIGAFSREKVDVLTWPEHQYVSFNTARDDFAQRLDQRTTYKLSGFVNMGNAIVGDPHVTTGDHDGIAVLIKAEQ